MADDVRVRLDLNNPVFQEQLLALQKAERLIADGGVFIGEEKITSPNHALSENDLEGDGVIIRKGKKTYCRIRKA